MTGLGPGPRWGAFISSQTPVLVETISPTLAVGLSGLSLRSVRALLLNSPSYFFAIYTLPKITSGEEHVSGLPSQYVESKGVLDLVQIKHVFSFRNCNFCFPLDVIDATFEFPRQSE